MRYRSFRRALGVGIGALALSASCLTAGTTGAVAATGGWSKLNSGTSQNLNSVMVLPTCSDSKCTVSSPNKIWAVGAGGTIIRSTDAGVHFTTIPSGTTQDLFAVGMAPVCNSQQGGTIADCIYVAGANGTLRVTVDNGTTWCDVAQDAGPVKFNGHIFSEGPNDIQLAGTNGTVMFGGNGSQHCPSPSGASFKKLPTNITTALTSFTQSAGGSRWVAGAAGTILAERSENPNTACNSSANGVWAFDKQTSGTTNDLRGIAGGLSRDIWAVGRNGTITHTAFSADDYAKVGQCGTIQASWALQPSGTVKNLNDDAVFSELSQGNPVDEFAVGDAGTILHSGDAKTWSAQQSGVCVNLNSVAVAETDTQSGQTSVASLTGAYAVGDGGTVLKYSPTAAAAPANGCAAVGAAAAPNLPKAGHSGGSSSSPAAIVLALLVVAGVCGRAVRRACDQAIMRASKG